MVAHSWVYTSLSVLALMDTVEPFLGFGLAQLGLTSHTADFFRSATRLTSE